ncbi:hypothetical protein COY13_01070 [Candidatus Roizmanbacteria bacterium CG_4_10_14_0_2_um_filter_36_35]|uniref:Nucleotidyltransferase n=4 Tax=Candidatus Roizmaniibacteriota TaxID=1752723 RepID=A0A2M7UBA8_9BACT|nr:MAG: hypothetical protein COV86_01635 [Candidatus Roizmanbacteria bacterium CG11_big_fil_rev_8_21_14_0_20_35_14]PIZ68503.1 MAG: hypothetical protein COY13_01070 [Candidatus Roizmanbacteria bacterium CG_4_10_14_0_2_um_filter_36_35]PJC32589.1 MAG: hypothetical protein CO049_02555 [Candidatus Roizmanbacteria bacterium CG_4_9_14_0_2_um_filter_36_12]
MNSFYQSIVTEKSWKMLQMLKKDIDFILIGGWAVYLYTKTLKSKDIDIIVDYQELDKIKKNFQLIKNDRLRKYEIKKEGIDIDIYLPYFSDLGLPVGKLIKHQDKNQGFTILKKEILLFTKLKAYQERGMTIKGVKDKIDIISLILLTDFNFVFWRDFIKKERVGVYNELIKKILLETKEIPELNLNQHAFAKKKKKLLEQVRSFQVTR